MLALLVNPDVTTAWTWADLLVSERIPCEITPSGADALSHARSLTYDVILAAPCLGDMSAITLAERSARLSRPVPLVIWGDRIAPDLITRVFASDVTDFCNGAAHIAEVVARLQIATSRVEKPTTDIRMLKVGSTINLKTGDVTIGEKTGRLTPKEAAILDALIQGGGRVLSKQEILNAAYGHLDQPELKIVDVFVSKIRKALGGPAMIETVWGRGYRFNGEWA
ncbi:winged helix-turn-helix transcriptional regulator [Pelagimonas varians]|uniref:Cell cycle response regulator CtrA n=1 Tax=Pelagimonas varians TaxID=696760 RepID=A0A238KCZ3_9RHOB|nr:response regulator transcription factor [Pelagimonas varians]PYG29956.1 DNA-binding response OmpR family regulator [Pelagimonas varians]SMX40653.1 Cell cycle response regulator CtrA [Pelagimonas varians]